MKRALACVLLLANTGCYIYAPVDQANIRPGERLRAFVTPEYGASVAGPLAPRIWMLTGDYTGRRADSLQVLVSYYRTESGSDITTDPTPIVIAPAALTRVEARRFSGKRSLLFGAAVGVGTALIIQGIKAVFNLSTTPDSTGPRPPGT